MGAMRMVQFQPPHLPMLILQHGQGEVGRLSRELGIAWMKASAESGTFLVDEQVRACCGVVPLWTISPQSVAEFWMFIDARIGRWGLLALHRTLKARLAQVPYRRIQTVVRQDFENGKRWAAMMGFLNEGLMEKYGPEGTSYYRYALVR